MVARAQGRGVAQLVLAAVAGIGHALVGFLYLVSGLAVPGWAVVLLLLWWLLLAWWLVRLAARRSWWTPAVPVVGVVTWVVVVTAGSQLLGWTA